MALLLVVLPEHISTKQTIVLVMPFRNRSRNQLRPVNRIKHVVDSQASSTAGTAISLNVIATTDTPTLGSTASVETGSKVNGIYLKVEVIATSSAALSNCYLIVFKNPGGNLTSPAANAVGANDNKRYVIHQEMIMLQKQDGSNPRTLFNGVIIIPRLYQRNGPNDVLLVQILAPGVNIDACFQCHYKEFR